MKNFCFGFTLAEVLITLAIIGVIATLTLPALQADVNEQKYIAALKKSVNTLTNAAQLSEALYGINYSAIDHRNNADDDAVFDDNGNLIPKLYAILAATTHISKRYSIEDASKENYPFMSTKIKFRDGTMIAYNHGGYLAGGDFIFIVIDVNGEKGPNKYSNCQNKNTFNTRDFMMARMYITLGSEPPIDTTECKVKKNRVIADRYLFYLNGNNVLPMDDASAWIMFGDYKSSPSNVHIGG